LIASRIAERGGVSVLIVGERLNTSRKEVNEAVQGRDALYVQEDSRRQVAAGADLVEVNAGSRRFSETEDLAWLIEEVQRAVPDARLCIDSSNPSTFEAIIGLARNRPMLNSVTAERARMHAMLPLLSRGGCDVIALCVDDQGIPKSVAQSMEVASRLVAELEDAGVSRERVFLDFALTALSTDSQAVPNTLHILRHLAGELPGVGTVCGLSNVSFGLPRRRLLNRTFLALAMEAGMSAAICDPLDPDLMATVLATDALLGRDRRCQRYSRAYREGRLLGQGSDVKEKS
jgi:cobalamin-dependent methionine synthase I